MPHLSYFETVLKPNPEKGLLPYMEAAPYHPQIADHPWKIGYQCRILGKSPQLSSRMLRKLHLAELRLERRVAKVLFPSESRVRLVRCWGRLYRTFLEWTYRTWLFSRDSALIEVNRHEPPFEQWSASPIDKNPECNSPNALPSQERF